MEPSADREISQRDELIEQLHAVAPAFGALNKRERTALRLRFGEDMTQAEIGERLGVSQMQVSRILRRSLVKLRESTDAGGSSPLGASA